MQCIVCGKDLGLAHKNKKYCSVTCNSKEWKSKNKDRAKEIKREYQRRVTAKRKAAEGTRRKPKPVVEVKIIDRENMTEYELCHEFNCDRHYLARSVKLGMPCHMVEGQIRYDLAKCQAWHRGEEFA
jgi:hypothetical protein